MACVVLAHEDHVQLTILPTLLGLEEYTENYPCIMVSEGGNTDALSSKFSNRAHTHSIWEQSANFS
jgi:hypothetical protein